jgi:hypothetical protein
MPFDPVTKTTIKDPYAVFQTHGSTVNMTSRDIESGFERLKGKRYTIADADKFRKNETTQFSAQLSFESAGGRLYNATLFYRSRHVKEISVNWGMPDDPVRTTKWLEYGKSASLADTQEGLAQATVSFYVERPGLHQLIFGAKFTDADGYLEVYPITLTDGPFAAPYLSGPTSASTGSQYYSQHQTTLHFVGDAAPKQGTWRKGSLIYNNNPAPGAPLGWICTREGEPGQWCPIGLIGNPLPDAAK